MPSSQTPTGIVALDDYAAACLALTMAQREILPKAANGRPIPASDDYARRVLKDMNDGKSQEWRRILAALLVNLKDGTPAQVVKAPIRKLDAIIDVEAGTYRPRALVAISRREQREQCLVDLSQMRMHQDENDIEALEQLSGELASYLAVADEMLWEVDRRITYLRRGDAPPVAPSAPVAPPPHAPHAAPYIVRLK